MYHSFRAAPWRQALQHFGSSTVASAEAKVLTGASAGERVSHGFPVAFLGDPGGNLLVR